MADPGRVLQAWIDKVRALGQMPETAAPEIAREVEQELEAQVREGVAPNGTPWQRTKDGRRPLQGAAKAIAVRVLKDVVLVRLTGHHARHHLGAVRGAVRRQIIPTGRIPDPMTRAIQRVVERKFKEAMS